MIKRRYSILVALLVVSHSSFVWSDEQPALYSQDSLSLELASKAVWASIKECRKLGYSVASVVVDRGGNIQAQLRDRFAGPHTTETAFRKAWTANSFRQSSGDLAGMLEEKTLPSQIPQIPGALLVGGGLMIEAAGSLVGAIGISGAPPGKSERDSIDGACARAGLEAIEEELAFAE